MTETATTANGFEITRPVNELNAAEFKAHIGAEFGINGETPVERIEQLKHLSIEGTAILLEDINKSVQGSGDSLMNHDSTMKIGGQETLSPEDRYDVFHRLVSEIKESSENVNPARVADTLALGVVLLHPFHDGNGRTARTIGLMFREDYDNHEFEDSYNTVTEPRDKARERGGFMIYGYVPRFPEGFDQTNPEAVSEYLSSLLTEDEVTYTSPFGPAPLWNEGAVEGDEKEPDPEDQIIENYDNFRSQVESIRSDTRNAELIGAGKHSDVFKVTNDGKEYVVRSVKQMDQRVEILHSHIAAGANAKGIKGLEKIVAASYEDGVVISEFAKGNHLQELQLKDIQEMPDGHLDALLATRLEAMQRGIQFDNHPANILYDSEQGFTDIDYHLAKEPYTEVSRLEAMKTVLGSLDLTEVHLYEENPDTRQQNEVKKTALHKRMNKYMEETFSKSDYDQLWNALVHNVNWRQWGYAQSRE